MIIVDAYAGRKVAVIGFGKSGLSVVRSLAAGGADVTLWDDKESRRNDAAAAGVTARELFPDAFRDMAALVLSPGVPLTHPAPHPAVVSARAAGVPVIGDIELFARSKGDARVVGVTGTNGKSTTTTLIGHLLKELGAEVAVGGNLGTPALDLPPLSADGVYVLELSSYQLDLTESLKLDVAICLNLSTDHLDRHGDMPGYIAAKKRVFRNQDSKCTAVVGCDDPDTRRICDELTRASAMRVVGIASTAQVANGVFAKDGMVCDSTTSASASIALDGVQSLLGSHNWQNAAAAVAAVRALGYSFAAIAPKLRTFAGLAHRMELIATIDGVCYVNDSKATNADATARALASFERIYWIAGGLPKAGGITSLTQYFDKIAHAFLIGTAAPEFAATLGGATPHTIVGTLDRALEAAHQQCKLDRRENAVVLLSPACASFDQFANFEARGDRFRALVKSMAAAPGARPQRCVA